MPGDLEELFDSAIALSKGHPVHFCLVGACGAGSICSLILRLRERGGVTKLSVIDAWPGDDWGTFMDHMKLSGMIPWVDIQHRPSLQGVQAFAKGSLDFVFINGPRASKQVDLDLAAWWPKLRTGGLFGGYHPGGEAAVSAFVASRGLVLEAGRSRLPGDASSWATLKPLG